MKYTLLILTVTALFLCGCGDSDNKPSTKDYEKQFAVQIPAYIELSSFDVEASENVGSKVEPYYKARFKATVKLKTKTFEIASRDNEVTLIRPVADEGEKKDIYGVADARLLAGSWKMDFNLENNPIPSMGHPKDFFTGTRVIIVGTAAESEFKAQMEQKKLADQQEADKALKVQQLEQEKQNAEREIKQKAEEQDRQKRKIALEAERKATEERFKEKKLEEEKLAAERERMPLLKTEENKFQFELQACYRGAGKSVLCEVLITNKGEDRDISVYAHERKEMSARAYDVQGNEYLANTARFGNAEDRNEIRKRCGSGVGLKAVFAFDNIPANTKTIKVLDLGVWTDRPWHTKLRNIPIAE